MTPSPTITPTPADIDLAYSYTAQETGLTLTWKTLYAAAFTIDGVIEPVSGRHTYPLATHTYLLVATSLDNTQRRVAALQVVVGPCTAIANGHRLILIRQGCRNGVPVPAATSTMGPIAAGTPTPAPTRANSGSPGGAQWATITIPGQTPVATSAIHPLRSAAI